ncbi:uncharacterized protein LY79DRAFT_567904 [Colletotrichum navitas]|uniref:Secreted protein n=1 Tax=Colletotrichum navitas TaxID=681940 RepID=A0AAD8PP26_9PEZI|nr:uncharacterized protein LY79DRAFT_567904 [Colletotrichum navitas]KAK1573774.1 hypothetical protein LY79DRAFT_567904 [Colletotrichum navitas]
MLIFFIATTLFFSSCPSFICRSSTLQIPTLLALPPYLEACGGWWRTMALDWWHWWLRRPRFTAIRWLATR